MPVTSLIIVRFSIHKKFWKALDLLYQMVLSAATAMHRACAAMLFSAMAMLFLAAAILVHFLFQVVVKLGWNYPLTVLCQDLGLYLWL